MLKLNKILIILLFGTIVLCSRTHAKSLDSGVPLPRIYTSEEVTKFIGQKVVVTFIDQNVENKIILHVIGVLRTRWDCTSLLLLGRTQFKNRMVIPIEKIILIKSLQHSDKSDYGELYFINQGDNNGL